MEEVAKMRRACRPYILLCGHGHVRCTRRRFEEVDEVQRSRLLGPVHFAAEQSPLQELSATLQRAREQPQQEQREFPPPPPRQSPRQVPKASETALSSSCVGKETLNPKP